MSEANSRNENAERVILDLLDAASQSWALAQLVADGLKSGAGEYPRDQSWMALDGIAKILDGAIHRAMDALDTVKVEAEKRAASQSPKIALLEGGRKRKRGPHPSEPGATPSDERP